MSEPTEAHRQKAGELDEAVRGQPSALVEIVANALAAAEALAIERCAQIADARAAVWRGGDGQCAFPLEEECEDIAKAIRDLTKR